jgi:hypothetical protein
MFVLRRQAEHALEDMHMLLRACQGVRTGIDTVISLAAHKHRSRMHDSECNNMLLIQSN